MDVFSLTPIDSGHRAVHCIDRVSQHYNNQVISGAFNLEHNAHIGIYCDY
jgi:hypothetical protein